MARRARPIRILYMEDDVALARLFKRKLNRAGYSVDLAHNGAEGLSMYEDHLYDVVAVDQNMPIHDGLEVIRILSSRGPLPPTIMITGTGNEKIAIEAMKLGAGDYIVKDVNGGYLELLPSVIDQLLHQERLTKEKEQAVETLQQLTNNLALLNLMGQKLTATLDLEQIMALLLPTVVETTGSEGAAVWLRIQGQEDILVCRAMFRFTQYRSPVDLKLRLGEGVAGWVAQKGESAIITCTADDPRFSSKIDAKVGLDTASTLAVPLRVRDAVIGVLEVVNKQKGDFDVDDHALVETLAASAAIAIDNAHLVETLRNQTEELQARNEELDAFAHTVAHDLKNPLSPILGLSQGLAAYFRDMPPEEVIEHLTTIAQSGHKMKSIIDELLLLASMHNMEEIEMEPLSMEFIVAEAQERLAYMIDEYNAEIVVPDQWPLVMGYHPWIEQVWVNYISNAIKYGGTPPYMELGATELTDGMVRFWIKDNGDGLDGEQRRRLFAPFTQLNKFRAQGHGLGLSIVRRIIDKLGGSVGVESKGIPGKGSVFCFTLPRFAEE